MATKRVLYTLLLIVILGVGLTAYVDLRTPPPHPTVAEAAIEPGDVVETVVATGTLQPVRSVTVGAQVSGTINHVMVDFNSIVHTGEVVATIDPSIIKAQLESAQAVLDQAKISLTAHTATLETDQRTLTRMASLFASGLETEQDRDAARLAVDEDTAQVKEDQEDVRVEQGDVDAAALNLQYCTITSPIDGVVIERDVDEGQTVTSRMAAPSLFTIGTDLTSLTLVGDVDESDVARIRPGQPVTFTVESYPTTFRGVVTESRLNATNTSNVVTYQTVIAVTNPDRRLLPGMTASFKIETGRASDVLRVPNTALRFRPTSDILAYYHAPEPPKAMTTAPALIAPPPAPAARTVLPTATSGTADVTIDRFFGPVDHPATSGHVWVITGTTMKPVPVTLGLTDGMYTELRGDGLTRDQQVVMNAFMPTKH